MTARKKPVAKPAENPIEQFGFDPEKPAPGTRVLEFRTSQGEKYRIQITDHQRFSFGSLTPGSKYGGGNGLALRIYEGSVRDNQIAVFVDVTDVRDISMPMARVTKPSSMNWDKFEKRSRDMTYAAFDVLSSYAAKDRSLEDHMESLRDLVAQELPTMSIGSADGIEILDQIEAEENSPVVLIR